MGLWWRQAFMSCSRNLQPVLQWKVSTSWHRATLSLFSTTAVPLNGISLILNDESATQAETQWADADEFLKHVRTSLPWKAAGKHSTEHAVRYELCIDTLLPHHYTFHSAVSAQIGLIHTSYIVTFIMKEDWKRLHSEKTEREWVYIWYNLIIGWSSGF